jgi:hypothetical protein
MSSFILYTSFAPSYRRIDISSIVGRDIGLMIRAFAVALEDDNLLVRRSALDLLLQSIRVDSTAVKNAQADDRTILMRAATGVVLRRDLSLNRRLYTWLLGPDEKSDSQLAFFREHTLELLKSTLKVVFLLLVIYVLTDADFVPGRDVFPVGRLF